jgi:hypothetical protein
MSFGVGSLLPSGCIGRVIPSRPQERIKRIDGNAIPALDDCGSCLCFARRRRQLYGLFEGQCAAIEHAVA